VFVKCIILLITTLALGLEQRLKHDKRTCWGNAKKGVTTLSNGFSVPILRVEVFCEFQIFRTRFEGKNLIQIMIF
jgi:hypothetical protein